MSTWLDDLLQHSEHRYLHEAEREWLLNYADSIDARFVVAMELQRAEPLIFEDLRAHLSSANLDLADWLTQELLVAVATQLRFLAQAVILAEPRFPPREQMSFLGDVLRDYGVPRQVLRETLDLLSRSLNRLLQQESLELLQVHLQWTLQGFAGEPDQPDQPEA